MKAKSTSADLRKEIRKLSKELADLRASVYLDEKGNPKLSGSYSDFWGDIVSPPKYPPKTYKPPRATKKFFEFWEQSLKPVSPKKVPRVAPENSAIFEESAEDDQEAECGHLQD